METTYRKLSGLAGLIYFLWWFAVHWVLPEAYNPLLGRLLVVGYFCGIFTLGHLYPKFFHNIRFFFFTGLWLLTFHYYYLFYHNGGDPNWMIGSFVTIVAVGLCFLTVLSLLAYSIFVLALSAMLAVILPQLREHSVFLPGIFTILLQANLSLQSRLRTLRSLAESNEQFQMLFNSTFEGVFVHEKRQVVNANQAFAEMVGYTRSELIGKDILDFVHPEAKAAAAERIQSASSVPYETKGITKDGRSIEIEVRGKSFAFGAKALRLVTVQKIDDRKKIEQERLLAQTMAENVRIRDEFITIASHELKTPLTSLKLQAEMMQMDLARRGASAEARDVYDPERIQKFVDLVNRKSQRLTELIETMLDVSRIATGNLDLEDQEVDLVPLAASVISLVKMQGLQADYPIELESPAHLLVSGDKFRLEQVLENLLTNAIKYGNDLPIKVKMEAEGTDALIHIQDRGIGVAPEYLDRIFNRFERAISAKNISGMGLGLYIARQIVADHGGSISVASKVGEGSTFTVRLPLRQTDNSLV